MYNPPSDYSGRIKISGALVVADFHVDQNNVKLEDVISPCKNRTVIIAGDIGRVENGEIYEKTIKWFSENFFSVVVVPGNHEYYTPKTKKSMKEIEANMIEFGIKYKNVYFFSNNIFQCNGIVVYAGTFWSYCPAKYFKKQHLYMKGEIIDEKTINNFHIQSQLTLQEAINFSEEENRKMIVITHYAPSLRGTIDDKYKNQKSNYMYGSNSEQFIENDCILKWIYGHTGYNGRWGKLTTNQYGKEGYVKNGVFT